MISQLFQDSKVPKSQRKKFIPFVNQRDFKGTLLKGRTSTEGRHSLNLSNNKNRAMIENIKKSSKEYTFDQQYQKMRIKLKRMKTATRTREYNYDKEVIRCFETLNYANAFENKIEDQTFYVDLNQELNQRIGFIKADIVKGLQIKKQARRCKTVKTTNLSDEFQEKMQMQEKENVAVPSPQKINRKIFSSIGTRSQYMADFTQAGLKYKNFVKSSKINPWKKWYAKQKIQLFPGEKITAKKLQKSIY